jgi:hypothetical protein
MKPQEHIQFHSTCVSRIDPFVLFRKKHQIQFQSQIDSLDLKEGAITLCGSGTDQFGTVSFSQGCAENVKSILILLLRYCIPLNTRGGKSICKDY